MQVKDYVKLKGLGNITLQKVGDKVLATKKNFNADTGLEAGTEIDQINLPQLKKTKNSLIALTTDISEFIKDIEAL